ncbi:hypothetical protein GQ43DRAFT_445329 [Delitschia confertaspora ATCC 74209]|uniref:Uncharacterized protein n=1 Tax=Delitschia confertaspora ATCC 74209 TaxID=1513339 RepID=A0A9P4JBF1_9PLEO|nr:hypothetical protein GQ43DRAFT_445329 [Delitschia confertaspora ATCC 74209]
MLKIHTPLRVTTNIRTPVPPQQLLHKSYSTHITKNRHNSYSHIPQRHSRSLFHPHHSHNTSPRATLPQRSCSRSLHSSPKMSSDADYMAFLEKANQDTGASATTQSNQKVGTTSVNTAVPKGLASVEEYYISDADEPFEPVALSWTENKLPSADDLKSLLSHSSAVTTTPVSEFDSKDQYKTVLDAVQKAGNGEVKVFRVELSETRAEYYVVSVNAEEGKVVGLKALAVES